MLKYNYSWTDQDQILQQLNQPLGYNAAQFWFCTNLAWHRALCMQSLCNTFLQWNPPFGAVEMDIVASALVLLCKMRCMVHCQDLFVCSAGSQFWNTCSFSSLFARLLPVKALLFCMPCLIRLYLLFSQRHTNSTIIIDDQCGAPEMGSRLSTLATCGFGVRIHWRPQPAKLPSFGGYSLETSPPIV